MPRFRVTAFRTVSLLDTFHWDFPEDEVTDADDLWLAENRKLQEWVGRNPPVKSEPLDVDYELDTVEMLPDDENHDGDGE